MTVMAQSSQLKVPHCIEANTDVILPTWTE